MTVRSHLPSTHPIARSLRASAVAIVLLLVVAFGRATSAGDTAALSLRATITAPATPGLPAVALAKAGALTISLSRWSTGEEREPLLKALSAPPPAPPRAPAAPATPGGRAGGRGRGGPPPAPPSPFARLSSAIKAAPTLGYIWTDGVTGYSIKYAWRSPATEEQERIVLVTDRRLNSHAPDWAPAPGSAEADFTVIEMHLDAHGAGEGKTSLTSTVAIDTAANTLALDDYVAAPALLKVTPAAR
jgi:hypothetical protein